MQGGAAKQSQHRSIPVAYPSSMRRPADGAGAGANELVGVDTLVILVVPEPAPSTLLMTPLYSD